METGFCSLRRHCPFPAAMHLGRAGRMLYCAREGTQRRKLPPPSQQSCSGRAASPLGTAAGDSDLGMAERGEFHPTPPWLFHPRSLDALQAMVLTPGGTVRYCTASAALAFWFQGYRNGWRQLSHQEVSCIPQIGSGCLPRKRGKGEREEDPEAGTEPGCGHEPHSSAPAWAM